jgi:hypothetical protein
MALPRPKNPPVVLILGTLHSPQPPQMLIREAERPPSPGLWRCICSEGRRNSHLCVNLLRVYLWAVR